MHLDISKEIILEEYKKKYNIEEMISAYVTLPLVASPAADAPPHSPARPENFREQSQHLLDERATTAASFDDTCMVVVKNRPAEAEPPLHPDKFLYDELYIKLKATLEVIFV